MAKRKGIELLIQIDEDGFEFSPFGPPDEPGVYMIIGLMSFLNGAHLFYVGSAKNINKRVSSTNHPYRKLYDRFVSAHVSIATAFIITPDYVELEKRLIRKYRPLLNRAGKNG
jgi:excinuclease UvrABC nuclease subunit